MTLRSHGNQIAAGEEDEGDALEPLPMGGHATGADSSAASRSGWFHGSSRTLPGAEQRREEPQEPTSLPALPVAPPPTTAGHVASPRVHRRNQSTWWFRLTFLLIDLYTLASFVMTSSLLKALSSETSVFLDDLRAGLYDFTPRADIDRHLRAELDEAKTLWNRRHNDLGTGSHCHRLGVDLGANNIVTYYGDGQSRRVIRKFHGALPGSCTGYTVPMGDAFDSSRRVAHVNDARLAIGQSYLHCTDPALWGPPFYDGSRAEQVNNTVFDFKATYVIVQQHFANAHYGIECQLSYCVAHKVAPELDYWAVAPATPDDTTAYVNILFTRKATLLVLLDVVGQTLMALIMLREVARVWTAEITGPVAIDCSRRTYWRQYLDLVSGRSDNGRPSSTDEGRTGAIRAGASRLRLSKRWLSNPFYFFACVGYGLGTTVESQMSVEVLYWQHTKSGNPAELLYAGLYSMRHAWVGMAIQAVLCQLLSWFVTSDGGSDGPTRRTHNPLLVLGHIRDVHRYVSSKVFIVAFFLAAIITTRCRGWGYLWDHAEVPDVGGGHKKSGSTRSEVFIGLVFHHIIAQVLAFVLGVLCRLVTHRIWPGHRKNSLIAAYMRNSWWAGFDALLFLSNNPSFVTSDGRFLVLANFSDAYLLYANANITGIPSIDVFEMGASDDSTDSVKLLRSTTPPRVFEVAVDSTSTRLILQRTPQVRPSAMRRPSIDGTLTVKSFVLSRGRSYTAPEPHDGIDVHVMAFR